VRIPGLRFVPLVWKTVTRQRIRTLLTVAGVATAMFLFTAIQSLRAGVGEATEETARDSTLVVYRENRFCPFTSRLPEYYEPRMRRIPGVVDVIPMKIVVSNCRASLDVATFRGVRPPEFAAGEGQRLHILDGSLDGWLRRGDAARVGATLAQRRGFRVGDRFESTGITVTVAGIFESDEPQDRNVAYVPLEFLQRAPGIDQVGIVTQFNVRVDDPENLEEIAAAIDAEFEHDEDPTSTRSEKAFVARAAADVMELVAFAGWVALGCVGAVLALVTNAILLSVQDRVRDYAVFQTLGYTGALIAGLVVAEGAVLGLVGGATGVGGAMLLLEWTDFAISNEGLSIGFGLGPAVWGSALAAAAVIGALAGLAPAVRALRMPIVESFRAV
jgi:putative ABC transport system permease protein